MDFQDRFKKILLTVLCAFLIIGITAASAVIKKSTPKASDIKTDAAYEEAITNRHARPENASAKVNCQFDTQGYELIGETDKLQLWLEEDTVSVRIRNKQSGYVWGNVSKEPETLGERWTGIAQSVLTLEYYDDGNNTQKIGISDPSVETKIKRTENGMICHASFQRQEIELSVELSLTDDGLVVSASDDSFKEGENSKISALYFMPFLGAVYSDSIDGYVFIPDGCGALIRYSKPMNYITGFSQKIYGKDVATDTLNEANSLLAKRTDDYLVETAQITMPVFGIVHGVGQNAIFAEVTKGAEYALINAIPAGVNTDYTWACASFVYRYLYNQKTGQDGAGFISTQERCIHFKSEVTYRFIDGNDADYNGMAFLYRDLLKERNVLDKERIDNQIPLQVDLMGAELKQELFRYKKTLTDITSANYIVDCLYKDGIKNLSLCYKGWQKGGYSGSRYDCFDFNSSVGKKSGFTALRNRIAGEGGRFYLALNVTSSNEEKINLMSDAIRTVSQEYSVFKRQNDNVMFNLTYYIRTEKTVAALHKAFNELKGFNFRLENTGSTVSSDYTRKKVLLRSNAISALRQTLEKSSGSIAMETVNCVLWNNTNEYFDIPTVNSQYLFETDSVPFLQMVLKGSLDYYAPYANQGFYSDSAVLKMVEYGAYPSFFLIGEKNTAIKDTPLEDYFSLNYDSWRSKVKSVYERCNKALRYTEGAFITEHKVLSNGLIRISYDNGCVIYVNYLAKEQKADGLTVPANDYLVKGGHTDA